MAHGFCSLTKSATLIYKTSTVYDESFDCGIIWSSVPVDWPVKKPIISKRDSGFPLLSDFESPFEYME